MDGEISRRINITRYLMVIGIVVLHMPPYQALNAMNGTAFEYIKAFFAHGVFRATVPALTAISGYLVFATGLHRKPLTLFSRKTSSILVPLIIWNLPLALALYIVQKLNLLSFDFRVSLYPAHWLDWANAVLGLQSAPVNYPLNFLRDLYVVSLLTPLFWLLLQRAPYFGFAVVFIVYLFNLDGPLVIGNTMLISFYTGALAAVKKWDLTALDRYAVPIFAAFILCCVAIVYFEILNREPLRFLAPFLVWPSISLIAKTRVGDWLYRNSKHSFFTFLSFGPVLLMLWVCYLKIPNNLPYPILWVFAPMVAVALAIVLHSAFEKRMPKLASVVLGGR